MVFEDEGEDICNRDTSPAGEELYIHIHTCTQWGRAAEIHYSFIVLIFTQTVAVV